MELQHETQIAALAAERDEALRIAAAAAYGHEAAVQAMKLAAARADELMRANNALIDQRRERDEMLRGCAERFRFYESQHRGKVEAYVESGARDPDTEAAVDSARRKAESNAEMARLIEELIGPAS